MKEDDSGDRWPKDVATMRREFDSVFAAPDPVPPGATDDFVAIRAGGRPFLLRVRELSRVEAGMRVVPLPGSRPALLGVMSIQGRLVPIYDLASTLGILPGRQQRIAVSAGETALGFAFDEIESYLRAPRQEFFASMSEWGTIRVQEAVRWTGFVWPVLHLPSLQDLISAPMNAKES